MKNCVALSARAGSIVAITFLDHAENSSDVLPFVVYGRLIEVTDTKLVLDSWEYLDQDVEHDENEKRFAIVRAAVVSVRTMEGEHEK